MQFSDLVHLTSNTVSSGKMEVHSSAQNRESSAQQLRELMKEYCEYS